MSIGLLKEKSLSLFTAVGGWRTIVESVASRTLFLVAYLLTGQVTTSALIAVGGVAVLTVVRMWTSGGFWQPALGLIVVGVSALLAGSTGQAVNFYLTAILTQVAAAAVVLVSILVRWPLVGLVMGTMRGGGSGWRRDRRQRRQYYACTAVFLAKFAIATAVMVPLYLAGAVVPLGVAATVVGGVPAAAVCVYLCWRILREEPGS